MCFPTVEYHSAIKRNEVLIHAITWINLENESVGMKFQEKANLIETKSRFMIGYGWR